jgi:hypothetical protein
MKIKLEKLEELPDALHSNNIEVGHIKIGEFLEKPEVGKPFYIGYNYRTSDVQEIIDEFTFKTYNSIYRYSFID